MIKVLKNIAKLVHAKQFSIFIQILVIVSLITFSIDTLPDLTERTTRYLHYCELLIVTIFSLEYILRVISSEKKLKYIFSFYGLIDLIAILPFYLSLGLDLRVIRLLRFVRLIRVFKLVRYNRAIHRFYRAFIIIKEELILFGFVAFMLLYFAGVGIYYFEHEVQPELFKSVFHGLWWAVTTLTTVGYGDAYPITLGGKIFTFIILMIGLGVVSVPTGLIASALSQARIEEIEKKQ